MNAVSVRVECPIVSTTGKPFMSGFDLLDRISFMVLLPRFHPSDCSSVQITSLSGVLSALNCLSMVGRLSLLPPCLCQKRRALHHQIHCGCRHLYLQV